VKIELTSRKRTVFISVKRKGARETVAILARMDLNNITKRKVGVEWWPVLTTIKFVLQKHFKWPAFQCAENCLTQ